MKITPLRRYKANDRHRDVFGMPCMLLLKASSLTLVECQLMFNFSDFLINVFMGLFIYGVVAGIVVGFGATPFWGFAEVLILILATAIISTAQLRYALT